MRIHVKFCLDHIGVLFTNIYYNLKFVLGGQHGDDSMGGDAYVGISIQFCLSVYVTQTLSW